MTTGTIAVVQLLRCVHVITNVINVKFINHIKKRSLVVTFVSSVLMYACRYDVV